MNPRREGPQPGTPSPCVQICEIDAATGLCRGCARTLDEIARWASMSDAERMRVLSELSARGLAKP
jgi:hypothetical protein